MAPDSTQVSSRMRAPLLWLPSLLMAIIAALLIVVLARADVLSFPASSLWLILLPMFLVTELTSIEFEFRRQTLSWGISEIPTILGLFLFGPLPAIVCRAVAFVLSSARLRFAPAKLVFNALVSVIEVAFAALVLEELGLTDPLRPSIWLGAVLIVFFASLLGVACIALAILITERRVTTAFWKALGIPLLIIAPMAATLGVAMLVLLEVSPWAAVLAAFLVAAFLVLYRRYAAEAQDRRSLTEVYEFAEALQSPSGQQDVPAMVLAAARERFNTERAALWIPGFLEDPPVLHTSGPPEMTSYHGPDDPTDAIRAKVVAGEVARRFVRGKCTAAEEAALERRAADEVLAVPLITEADEPGYLEVCERSGQLVRFTQTDVELLDSLANHIDAAVRQQQLQSRIRHDSTHDPVTGLPNRVWLSSTVDDYLGEAPADAQLAVLIAEIGGFGQVNETLGYAAGDEILRVVSVALRDHAPEGSSVARLGGAQFGVTLPGATLRMAETAAARLRQTVSSRVPVSGISLSAELTVGVAVAPHHGNRSGTLLQRAEIALLAAQARNQPVASYSTSMDQQSLRRLQLGADLGEAIENRDVSVVFQPIIGTRTGEIASVEVLARWTHPSLGTVSPDEFIPLSERIGLILPLTWQVIDVAMTQCQRWLDEGVTISMAVNISSQCLAEPNFVSEVARRIAARRFPADLFTFEITEGSFVSEGVAISALRALHELGVRLAVDDFGTGYSSLSYLRRLPIDEVKIDKSFVLGMTTDTGANIIARSIIDLAHNLGLRVVAEGVEDEMTRDLLADMNCDFLQGYLISRPLPDDHLSSWLAARTATHPVDRHRNRRKLYIRG